MYKPSARGSKGSRPLMGPSEPVWGGPTSAALYGEDVWDLRPIIHRESLGDRTIDLRSVPASYRESVRNFLVVLANPTHPAVVEAGVVHSADPTPAAGITASFYRLRKITLWGDAQGLSDFPDWTPLHANRFLQALREGKHGPAAAPLAPTSIRRYVGELKNVRRYSSVLPGGGLSFQPWGSMAAHLVAQTPRQFENATLPLPWETWGPIVAGAWAVVDRFSPDILAAIRAARLLPKEVQGSGGTEAWHIVRQWADDGGVLPLHTGFGRVGLPRGEPNPSLLARKLHIPRGVFRSTRASYRPELIHLFEDMATDPSRSALGGFIQPTVMVGHSDGPPTPWISEIGLGETEYLGGVLRAACYVVLASLTGMRDSEIQSLKRDSLTTLDGLPAVAGRQYKGVSEVEGRHRGWWAPEAVHRTIEVISALSPHPVYLFTRGTTRVSSYAPQRDITRLVEFINGDPEERVGRGGGLGLEAVHVDAERSIGATSLRRSFSIYAVARPSAELGLTIQLGHLGVRTTTGYLSDGAQQLTKMMDTDRQAILRKYSSTIVLGSEAVAGPAGKKVQELRAQIITDPRRAEQLTSRLAERLHLGVTNDCMYNAPTAACGPNGPSLGDHICAGSDCANSLYTTKHRKTLEAHIERIDGFLDGGKGHPQFYEVLRKDRARIVSLIREMNLEQGASRGDIA